MLLSKRLMCIANQINGKILADIGTDHGYLPIYLIKNNIIEGAIASDVSQGSCNKAENNICQFNLKDKIQVRCGDGLKTISVEDNVDCITMSGMGGMLTIHIMESNKAVVQKANQIILQPQKDIYKVRKYIHSIGHKIINEECLYEDNKFYNIINTVKGTDDKYTKIQYYLGRFNLERKPEAFVQYLIAEIKKLQVIIENMEKNNADINKIMELKELLNIYKEGLK